MHDTKLLYCVLAAQRSDLGVIKGKHLELVRVSQLRIQLATHDSLRLGFHTELRLLLRLTTGCRSHYSFVTFFL